MTESSCGI